MCIRDSGKGGHVWDVDGNEYVDFVNGLCAVTLGYDDADVTRAVKAQLEDGVIFTLPHPLEMQVAEAIVDMVPCAEMVRFGKNGSDVTAAAVRLARAFTGRDHVAVCGYHGWQDWYIGSTARNRGVPEAVRNLTHAFAYNDLESLRKMLAGHPGEVAAVILEPMNSQAPKDGFLEGVKELTHRHGALLVFDEVITGFRLANGGAQELFGVTPDLACFGKGVANGYPVSLSLIHISIPNRFRSAGCSPICRARSARWADGLTGRAGSTTMAAWPGIWHFGSRCRTARHSPASLSILRGALCRFMRACPMNSATGCRWPKER